MKTLKWILVGGSFLVFLGCVTNIPAPVPTPTPNPYPAPASQFILSTEQFDFMNRNSEPGKIVVVPPEELRLLRDMTMENKVRLDKVEVKANRAEELANRALQNQSSYEILLQALSKRIEDYRAACQAIFEKMLKK